MDPILIANEIVDWWRCSKQQGVIIKLDVKKAFDKINWKFLLTILKLKGFSNKWINWIYGCISSLGYSILINGSPRGYTSKQSRQGDHLSPFLFVLAMDYLSSLIDDAQSKGVIQGYSPPNGTIHISQLLFADNILLFSINDSGSLQNLRFVVNSFEATSGLKINLQKSSLAGVNTDPLSIQNAINIWNCSASPCHLITWGCLLVETQNP